MTNLIRVELTHVEDAIKQDIEAGFPQKEVAKTYALGIISTWPTDWRAVNEMIVERWSLSGLKRVKQMAHSGRCFDD